MAGNFVPWLKTVSVALGYLGFCGVVGKKRLLPNKLSRKMMHIGVGPLYLLCWPLYTSGRSSPWVCATVPLLASLHFGLVARGAVRDPSLVAAATRTGDRRELLRGPLLYGLVQAAATVLLWRRPAAVLSISVLCGGDGLAEVVGSSVTSPRLPHNKDKSVAGSAACFLGGVALSLPLLLHFRRLGLLTPRAAAAAAAALSTERLVGGAILCSALGAAVESLPAGDLDNLAVPAAVAAAARLYFGF